MSGEAWFFALLGVLLMAYYWRDHRRHREEELRARSDEHATESRKLEEKLEVSELNLEEMAEKHEAELRRLHESIKDFAPLANLFDKWSKPPWYHTGNHHGDIEADRSWALQAADVWQLVDQLSADSRRVLDEITQFDVPTPNAIDTDLAQRTREVRSAQPQSVQVNLFDLRSWDLQRLASWLGFVSLLGPSEYECLNRIALRLKSELSAAPGARS